MPAQDGRETRIYGIGEMVGGARTVQTQEGYLGRVVGTLQDGFVEIVVPGIEERRQVAANHVCEPMDLEVMRKVLESSGVKGFARSLMLSPGTPIRNALSQSNSTPGRAKLMGTPTKASPAPVIVPLATVPSPSSKPLSQNQILPSPRKDEQPAASAAKPTSLAAMFGPKDGEWRCKTCATMNKASATDKCPCCETPKPGAKPAAAAGPAISFGFGGGGGAPAGTSPAPLKFGFGASTGAAAA
eukprot:85613-Rhodomonas_salina.1